jgi:hypothetical protein
LERPDYRHRLPVGYQCRQFHDISTVVFWEGIFRGLGGLFHTLNHPISPTKRPNTKRKSKTKAFFVLPELISPPPSTCPITTLVDTTRPPSRAPHPPPASGCVRGVPCRSTHSIFAWNSIFYPDIRPPHPSFRAPTLRRFALQCNERPGVRTQRVGMDIDPRTPHVPLINTGHLLGVEKTSFQYWPDICCMCLLRGPNGHIQAIYPASRQSVSMHSWHPKLPSCPVAPSTRTCPLLKRSTSIASASHQPSVKYPLTREK